MSGLLAELFSSKLRAAVLGHILARPHLGFSLTDLSRLLDLPVSSLQHECYKLVRIGVLRDQRAGNARLYRPDPRCPLLEPLTTLILAAIGPEAGLAAAVEGVPGLELALVAGHLRPTRQDADPVHLVLVGELPLEAVDGVLARAVAVLGPHPDWPPIELAYFRPGEWAARRAAGNRYLSELLAGPVVSLVGGPP